MLSRLFASTSCRNGMAKARRAATAVPAYAAEASPSQSISSRAAAATFGSLRLFSTAPDSATTTSIQSILSDSNRILTTATDADLFDTYITDWTGRFKGENVVAVVFPKTTSEVSSILTYCHKHDICVVPQGGNTGLVGGGVGLVGTKKHEIILSLEKMNNIIKVDSDNFTVTCEAGCVLQTLSTHLEDQHDLIVPLDLGAKGSCQIGGNIATNAGGLRVIKYGNIGKHVLGMEVVLADGTILDMLKTLRKDNTGYNLSNLFIGSEGTLGIITKVALSVSRKPSDVRVSFIAVDSMQNAIKLLGKARKNLGEHLSSFELIDRSSLKAVIDGDESQASLYNQFNCDNIHVMLETSDLDDDGLLGFMEECFEEEIILDSIMSQNETHSANLWRIREMIPVCLMDMSRQKTNDLKGRLIKYDVSIDVNQWDEFLNSCRDELRSKGFPIDEDKDDKSLPLLMFHNFGHMGDANMHLNILLRSEQVVKHNVSDIDAMQKIVDDVVYSNVGKFNGSISAEHCIGQLKSKYLPSVKSRAEYDAMRNLKQVMDPKNILNPGKMLII